MIPIQVKVTPKSLPSNYTVPGDMQGVLEAIAQYTDYEAEVTGPAVVVNKNGANADQNSIWVWLLTGSGPRAPLAPRVMTGYRSDWWQVYTGKPGEIRTFCGPPGNYFDSSGRGLEWSGWEGWALCNGNNGTDNLAKFGHFVVPGYRYASGKGWVTKIGSELDQPGGSHGAVGGGGYGPGVPAGSIINYPDTRYNPPAYAVTWPPGAPVTATDAQVGGWSDFQIAPFNLGNGSGTVFCGVNINLNMQGGSNNNYEQTGSMVHPTGHGGERTVSAPGPAAQLQNLFVGYWTYPCDQNAQMLDQPVSRLPPYIALGYVQFIGYR
jgi:hypothetical protein